MGPLGAGLWAQQKPCPKPLIKADDGDDFDASKILLFSGGIAGGSKVRFEPSPASNALSMPLMNSSLHVDLFPRMINECFDSDIASGTREW